MAEGAVLQNDQHKTAVFCMKFGNAQHSSCLAGQYLSKMYVWCHWCIQSREIKAQATCLRSPTVTARYEGALVFGLVACQELHTK